MFNKRGLLDVTTISTISGIMLGLMILLFSTTSVDGSSVEASYIAKDAGLLIDTMNSINNDVYYEYEEVGKRFYLKAEENQIKSLIEFNPDSGDEALMGNMISYGLTRNNMIDIDIEKNIIPASDLILIKKKNILTISQFGLSDETNPDQGTLRIGFKFDKTKDSIKSYVFENDDKSILSGYMEELERKLKQNDYTISKKLNESEIIVIFTFSSNEKTRIFYSKQNQEVSEVISQIFFKNLKQLNKNPELEEDNKLKFDGVPLKSKMFSDELTIGENSVVVEINMGNNFFNRKSVDLVENIVRYIIYGFNELYQ